MIPPLMRRLRHWTLRGALALGLVFGFLTPQTANAATGDPVVTYYPLPWYPQHIGFGSDGRVWTTNADGGRSFGAMTTDGKATEYRFHGPVGQQGDLAAGPDRNMWIAQSGGGKVARVRPDGRVFEYDVGRHTHPFGLAFGPDGNLWMAQRIGNEIGELSPSGHITEHPVPIVGSRPLGIIPGPGGIWFTLSHAHRIGFIPTGSDAMQLFRLQQGSNPQMITVGSDGNLWFSINRQNVYRCGGIGRITPTGVITEFDLPICQQAYGVTPGPGGNIWFTAGPDIGYVTTSGDMTEWELHPGPGVWGGIVEGPDGAIWFSAGMSIGRLVP